MAMKTGSRPNSLRPCKTGVFPLSVTMFTWITYLDDLVSLFYGLTAEKYGGINQLISCGSRVEYHVRRSILFDNTVLIRSSISGFELVST